MNAAWPLGVDVLEWKKARAFYRTHRKKLSTFLCPAETLYVESSRKPYESLAMLLSAKEAVFKSLGVSWMGISGFKHIRIRPGKKNFSFRLRGKKSMQISFAKSRCHVIACCHSCERVSPRSFTQFYSIQNERGSCAGI